MSYVFYCSKCRFDHAGECKSIIQRTVEAVDGKPRDGESPFITQIRELVKALEAGSYNAKPSKLHQCKRDIRDCDVCYPPGSIDLHNVSVKDGNISLSYSYKMSTPLTFIPITFDI